MRKLFFATILIACASSFSFAQDDYHKYDVYAGYSHNWFDFGNSVEGFNGVEGAVKGNITRYVGLKADYAFHFKSFDEGLASVDGSLHTLVGGAELKDNSTETKLKPFAHLMGGFTHLRVSSSFTGTDTNTGFALVAGGGLDIRINRRVDIRVVQLDYAPTRLGGGWQHNVRLGGGIVFR
jgi:outer membrane protein with beta-barrel domain